MASRAEAWIEICLKLPFSIPRLAGVFPLSFRGCNDKLNLKWQRKVLWCLGTILIIIVLVFWRLWRQESPSVFREFALDTMVEIQVWGPGAKEAAAAAMAEIRRLEGLLSQYQPGSDLSRLARTSGGVVDEATYKVLGQALQIANESHGAYDPTIGGLSLLWQQAREEQKPPDKVAIQQAHSQVGWQSVTLLPPNMVKLKEGIQLDLGGAAKGYAVDKALFVLKKRGIRRALVNAGGQIGLLGTAPSGLWQVGVQAPREEGLVAVLELKGGAVSTSGDYQRFFMYQGRRYHHLLDPKTGYPAAKCQSATVVAKTGLLADLLSTACYLLGPKGGLELVEKYGAQALVVDSRGKLHTTAGLSYVSGKGRN